MIERQRVILSPVERFEFITLVFNFGFMDSARPHSYDILSMDSVDIHSRVN